MLLNIYSGNLSGMYDLLSLIGLSSWSVIVLPTSAFMHIYYIWCTDLLELAIYNT